MQLQASLHAVDAAAADFQAPVDGGRVEASFKQLLDVLLHLRRLLARARHRGDAVSVFDLIYRIPVVCGGVGPRALGRQWAWCGQRG